MHFAGKGKVDDMIGLIVAYDKNRVIGNKGCIPWRIKGEQRRFKELTTGNIVIMGRKSHEEIGKALPNRINIIVSNTKKFTGENLYTVGSLQEAIDLFADSGKNIYISGGAGIYEEALPLVDVLYITEVDLEVPEGDTYFPVFDESLYWKEINEEVEGEIPYRYVTYKKIYR